MGIALFETVALRSDLPVFGLKRGDLAVVNDCVPHPAGGEDGLVLEVFSALGESLMTVVVAESEVEPLQADEVLAVRHLARSA